MSRTNKGNRTEGVDNYPTPKWSVRRFLEKWDELYLQGERWLEPCVGDGAICEVVNEFKQDITWTTCDIRDTRADLTIESTHHVTNFLTSKHFAPRTLIPGGRPDFQYDVAIFNPPFRLTLEFVQRCMKLAPVVICMQRINYLGSADRNEWMRRHMPDLYVIPNRVSFSGNGKADSVENGWHLWEKREIHKEAIDLFVNQIGGLYLLNSTPLEERRRDRDRVRAARGIDNELDALLEPNGEWVSVREASITASDADLDELFGS